MSVSRRAILRTAVGAAAAMPLSTIAIASSPLPLTPEETIDALGKQICDAARIMCPAITSAGFFWNRRQDGTFELFVSSKREFERYTGPGLYEVSMSGAVVTFWLERDDIVTRSGHVLEQYAAAQYYEGVFDHVRYFGSVNIIRKLEDAPCHQQF